MKLRPDAAGDDDLQLCLRQHFQLKDFRPRQAEVCRDVLAGQDVLLVMPTGAGKSLCYQLPGLMRPGATLVISPLIALMEDQVGKLQQLGLRAERIHSGRDRYSSRQVCRDYLAGELDFLFIAPERLSVPGFPEMLAKRSLGLIAVDEAHCISHWGHDFRPDYRLLSERLPLLRPAPVIALTATATSRVQEDILTQLAAPRAKRHIHGFRRDNLAVEVVETPRNAQRVQVVQQVLHDARCRPAIVYAPTRKDTEQLAAVLSADYASAAYHAGLEASQREWVQQQFLTSELEVIVATIAFGMGVDKPNIRTVIHTGLPGSVEGYYQEIGRAGRDGLPARAVLLYSWADRRLHEFFHASDYPDISELTRLHRLLTPEPQSREQLAQRFGEPPELFDKTLERLWQHGGLSVTGDSRMVSTAIDWATPYQTQCAHKQAQLDAILEFARGGGCRMLALVAHFGAQADSGKPCGVCDHCAPLACQVRQWRPADASEQRLVQALLAALRQRDGQTTRQLHQQLGASLERRAFETLLTAVAMTGRIQLADDEFVKDGRTIRFRRVFLQSELPGEMALRLPAERAAAHARRSRSRQR